MTAPADGPDASADETLRRLYQDRYGALVHAARALADQPGDAEELVQDAFARCLDAWRRKGVPDDPEGYVRTAVLNRSRSRVRRAVRWRRVATPRAVEQAPADRGALAHADHTAVIAAVRQLPQRQRECVALRHLLEQSVTETAAQLGISEGSVKTHTHRGLAALAQTLEDHR